MNPEINYESWLKPVKEWDREMKTATLLAWTGYYTKKEITLIANFIRNNGYLVKVKGDMFCIQRKTKEARLND